MSRQTIKVDDSVLHEFLYCHIRSKCKNSHIPLAQLLYLIKNVVRVPKSMDQVILKELEDKGYIRRINHQSYFICRGTNQCERSLKRIKKYKRFTFW